MRRRRVPHRIRHLASHTPHHVVMTTRAGLPVLYRRDARLLFGRVQRATLRRYPDVSFAAAVLMHDHVHLVIQPRSAASRISRVVQYLASNMARGLNRICGCRGSVFRERFFSRVLATVSELVRTLKYVGMNPVKAGLCASPDRWCASSVRDLFANPATDRWRFPGWMYRLLGFAANAREALRRILCGETAPRAPGRARQRRLPFGRGSPVGA